MKYLTGILIFTFVVLALAFGVWWVRYSYQDCLMVGRSRTYCIVDKL